MAIDFKKAEIEERQESLPLFKELYKLDHPDTQDKDFTFNENENTFSDPKVQGAWWGWCKQLILSGENGCSCEFEDSSDTKDNTSEINEAMDEITGDKVRALIMRVNQFGISELLDEFERLSFEYGTPIQKEKLIKQLISHENG